MDERPTRNRLLLAAVGLAQGYVYWRLTFGDARDGVWPMVIASLVTTVALTVQYAWDGRHAARLLAGVVALAVPLTTVTWWVWAQLPGHGDEYRVGTWSVAYGVALYVLMPFVQLFQANGRLHFPYPGLFRHSWNNFFIGFVAWTFAAVFWALIGLWAMLFKLVGIEFFFDVFFSRPFLIMASTTIAGAGIAIGRETDTVTNMLRRVTLAQFRALMPILIVIVLLFVAALPLTGVAPLWATKRASALLLCLIGAVILFLNAVVQDGEGEPPYPAWLRRALEAAVLVTPVLCVLLVWAIGLRIAEHGLTPDRVYVVVFAAIASLYAVGYAAAVLWRRGRWLALLQPTNVAMALLVATLAILLHTPLLDPLAWSARHQESRLMRGVVAPDQFDYAVLGRLGREGAAALQRLAALEGHPEAERIRRAARVRQAPGWTLTVEHVSLVGGVDPPTDLFGAIRAEDEAIALHCVRDGGCALFALDVILGGDTEYCLLAPGRFPAGTDLACWETTATGWRRIYLIPESPQQDPGTLRQSVEAGGAETIAPRFRDIRIGDTTFRVRGY